jgi:hypothetical protein
MAGLSPTPKQQIFGSDGAPLVGGKIYTYLAGTSTPATTYTDYSAGTANTNPIILDSYGQANIWLLSTVSYKFVVKTSTDVLLYTVDNIATPLDISALAAPPPIGSTTPNTGAFTTLTASGAFTLTGNGAMKLNAGTTAERPTPSNGMIRYNTSTPAVEGYINGAWTSLVSGTAVTSVATGTGLTGGPITSTGTIAIDSTVATLTGTQTLTNKTIQGGTIASGTAQSSTTGTSITFTSIPSWVKRITIQFVGVSTSGSSVLLIRAGSASIETTGYSSENTNLVNASSVSGINSTVGFAIANPSSAYILHGNAVMTLQSASGNTWTMSSVLARTDAAGIELGGGSKSFSGVIDRVSITTTNGTDTFDAGSVNILFE